MAKLGFEAVVGRERERVEILAKLGLLEIQRRRVESQIRRLVAEYERFSGSRLVELDFSAIDEPAPRFFKPKTTASS